MTRDQLRHSAALSDVLFVGWVALAAVALMVVLRVPGSETVPFHLALAGFALAFSQCRWPLPRTLVALGTFCLLIAMLFVRDAVTHALDWTEATEVPIAALLVAGVVWHVNRTRQALDLVQRAAEKDRALSEDRERLARLTSHEMRTPLTVVMGFLDLALAAGVDVEVREYLGAVREEVTSLHRVVDRAVRAAYVRQDLPVDAIEVKPLLESLVARWHGVAWREWVVDADDLSFTASRERLVAGLDTLVENAVRYTGDSDVIRLVGRQQDGWILLGVADGGAGMSAELRAVIDERASRGLLPWYATAEQSIGAPAEDPEAGTGLGLEIVRRATHVRGGILVADVAPEGGALVGMWVPLVVAPAFLRPPPGEGATGGQVPDPGAVVRQRVGPRERWG